MANLTKLGSLKELVVDSHLPERISRQFLSQTRGKCTQCRSLHMELPQQCLQSKIQPQMIHETLVSFNLNKEPTLWLNIHVLFYKYENTKNCSVFLLGSVNFKFPQAFIHGLYPKVYP